MPTESARSEADRASGQGKTIFIVHGRHSPAYLELEKLINSLGLATLSFDAVANSIGSNPLTHEVVAKGIEQADAVIVLFTADEHAAFYDLKTNRLVTDGDHAPRWQARPNVLFEVGVASSQSKPILAKLGPHIQLSSDLGGYYTVQLDIASGKRNLYERLKFLLGPLREPPQGWDESPESGNFLSVVQSRWRYYDEIDALIGSLQSRMIPEPPKRSEASLFQIIQKVLDSRRDYAWHRSAQTFMAHVREQYSETVTDESYWYLHIHGVLTFDNIKDWGKSGWKTSVAKAEFAERAAYLFERMRWIP